MLAFVSLIKIVSYNPVTLNTWIVNCYFPMFFSSLGHHGTLISFIALTCYNLSLFSYCFYLVICVLLVCPVDLNDYFHLLNLVELYLIIKNFQSV